MCACHGDYVCGYHRKRRYEEEGLGPPEAAHLSAIDEANWDWHNDPYPYRDLETKRAMEASAA